MVHSTARRVSHLTSLFLVKAINTELGPLRRPAVYDKAEAVPARLQRCWTAPTV